MSGSKFEYVRKFELKNDTCLQNTYMVVRIDGRGFSAFTKEHGFEKPNDRRALDLMNDSAYATMRKFGDIVMAYGQSDEYSFVFSKSSNLFGRRSSKIISCLVSYFTASYVMAWSTYFQIPLHSVPHFDGRVVLYPSFQNLRDYFSWRQADCHINNLYNTCFWGIIKTHSIDTVQAQERLKGTVSSDKHDILFSECGINYNNEEIIYRKGSVIIRRRRPPKSIETAQAQESDDKEPVDHAPGTIPKFSGRGKSKSSTLTVEHIDIIGDAFWEKAKAMFE